MADKAQDMKEKYDWKLNLADEGRFAVMSLGAMVMRLDSGDVPTEHATVFTPYASGAEYNVAANVRRYGLETAVLTAMGDYSIGNFIRNRVREVGVEILGPTIPHTPWRGHHATVYSYSPAGCLPNDIDYNRSNEAATELKAGMLDYNDIFKGGVRWVHSGGLFAALAPHIPELIIEYFTEAKKRGAVVSFDLNYRPALWKPHGGQGRAIEAMSEIVKKVDILYGNETDAEKALGIKAKIQAADELDIEPFKDVQAQLIEKFGNLKVIVTSLRYEIDNNRHLWGAVASVGGKIYTVPSKEIYVLCRIGGGDGLAGGFSRAIFDGMNPQKALYMGQASGALVASVHGDITQANWDQVKRVAEGYEFGKTPKVNR